MMRLVRITPLMLCLLATLSAGCTQSEQPAPTAAEAATNNESRTANKPVVDAPDMSTAETPDVESDVTDPAEIDQAEIDQAEKAVGELAVGSPAPALKIASLLLGDEVESFAEGQVYVVEFWATWCGPCTASMPHLSQLQQDYGDQVRMIGISDESDQTVSDFLDEEHSSGKPWREVLQYAIATDDDESTNQAYMQAAGQNGIPTAFVVGRDGVIEWIGHPLAMDEPLAKIVANEWDRAAAIAEFEQQRRIDKSMSTIIAAMGSENWDEALKTIDDLIGESPPSPRLSRAKLSILQTAGRNEEAALLQAEIVEQQWDRAQVLNEIAWSVAVGDEPRDLELAMRAARRASELTDDKDPSILDTLARVYYEQGHLDEAIIWQKKAAAAGTDISEVVETLKRYESEKAANGGGESVDSESSGSQPESTKDE